MLEELCPKCRHDMHYHTKLNWGNPENLYLPGYPCRKRSNGFQRCECTYYDEPEQPQIIM